MVKVILVRQKLQERKHYIDSLEFLGILSLFIREIHHYKITSLLKILFTNDVLFVPELKQSVYSS